MEIGGPRCAKYTLYFVNILIIVLALVTLAVGIWMSTDVSGMVTAVNANIDPRGESIASVEDILQNGVTKVQSVANVLTISGVFALLIGFLGIWAAYRESRFLLITYTIVLIIIVLMEMSAGIAWSVYKPKLLTGFTNQFNAALPYYDFVATAVDSNKHIAVSPRQLQSNATASSTVLINVIQTWVGCCGSENGYQDFARSPLYWSKSHHMAPVFCCKLTNTRQLSLKDPDCGHNRTADNSYMNVGCTEKVTAWVYHNAGTIAGSAIGIGIINILGIVAAIYDYRCLSREYKERLLT
ncbi:hypothetical protein BV898_03844 [Hypsibius exemplaris]|uniref:Tetraspanin n=1 Tax=Hypsibius exemplaris TaxID=2072580 RepID=A0A1W0X475_HYPEX|nr:hypothetical protein BV898_03844 [Hypsibius exemplaris]